MNTTFRLLPMLGLLAAPLPAQAFYETFSYPDGPIPSAAGWTAQTGSWGIRNGKLIESPATLGHKYLTKDGIVALDCVVEIDCKWAGLGIQAGGTIARQGGTPTESCVMGKVQSNSATVGGFDTSWLYERPGGVIARTGITPLLSDVRVRLVVLGTNATLSVDTDRDGVFDMVIGTLAIATHNTAGLVGVVTGNSGPPTEMDNFAFFDAVLEPQPGTSSRVGMSFKMNLHTPATQVTPYIGLAALSAGPLPIGNRGIPLGLDPLLNLSLSVGGALGLVGLTDAAGLGTPSFNIPNDPALVGLGVFVSAFTLDGQKPFGIGFISKNTFFQIQP